MKIINKVTNCPTIAWNIIKTWEFNQLKDNSNRDVKKLKNSIINNGFIAPFDCWKNDKGRNYIIDGTGRNLALLQLETEGIDIPELPVLFIDAKDLKEAKKFALQRSSTHGTITQTSLADFISTDFEIIELKELASEEFALETLEYMISNLEGQDFSNKNKEIEANNLGNESSVVFKYSHQEYLNVLDLLNNAKEQLGCDTNEQTLKQLLADYE